MSNTKMSISSKRLSSVLLVTLVSASLWAQSPEQKLAAEGLFDAGKKLMTDGNLKEACPKFAESDRLDAGIGVKLYLADCYEKSGKTASAWSTFKAAAAMAAQKNDNREKIARERAANLEKKLSKITINVTAEAASIAGIVVKQDGLEVTKPMWGVSVAVDPGEHTIEATAPGREAWVKKITVVEQKDEAVSVGELSVAGKTPVVAPTTSASNKPAPVPVASSVAPAVTAKQPPPPPPPPAQEKPVEASGSSRGTIGLVVAGVGLVGIGVGAYFGTQVLSKNSDAEKECNAQNQCSQKGLDLTEDAKSARTLSYVSFGLGGAALVVGSVLFFTAPSSKPKTTGVQVQMRPVADTNLGGFALEGKW